MKWLYRNLYRKEKGFTLVELMIVIIIIAILTGIAIPSYMVLRDRARESAAKAELLNIATALGIFEADWEEYPATAATLVAELTGVGATINTTATSYMNPVPANDDWTNPYTYANPGLSVTGTGYSIYSYGPNKTDDSGLVDDIIVIDGQLQ